MVNLLQSCEILFYQVEHFLYQRLYVGVWYNESRKAITVIYPSFIIEGSLIVVFIEIWTDYVMDSPTNLIGDADQFTHSCFLFKKQERFRSSIYSSINTLSCCGNIIA